MSNFICPHCKQIIDDGSDGFTSDREIELEKKLDIAVKALKKIELLKNIKLSNEAKIDLSFKLPREALTKIKEIK